MTWIKVCGLTSVRDAVMVASAGASAIGLVFAPSPRRVSPDDAREIADSVRGRVEVIGVFKEGADVAAVHAVVGFDRIQIHGFWDSGLDRPVLRAVTLDESRATPLAMKEGETLMIDGSEGRGRATDWSLVPAALVSAAVFAGGFTPGNVAEAVRTFRPFGVDVSSGVESAPGVKDGARVREFVAAVRRAR